MSHVWVSCESAKYMLDDLSHVCLKQTKLFGDNDYFHGHVNISVSLLNKKKKKKNRHVFMGYVRI